MTRILIFKAIAFLITALILPSTVFGGSGPVGKDAAGAGHTEIRLAETSRLPGGWRGKLGDHEIMVCISDKHATYYTIGHYSRISMDLKDGGALLWQESFPAGHIGLWKIDAENGEALTGQWKSQQETLPIRLTRIHSKEGGARFCEEIYRELARAESVKQGQPQELHGLRFRKLSAINGYVSSVEILNESGKYAELNKHLRTDFENNMTTAFACEDVQLFDMDKNEEFPYVRGSSLFALNGHWVTLLDEGGGHCGSEGADNLPHLVTLDTETAKPLNLNRWLQRNPDQSREESEGSLYSPPDNLTSLIYEYTARLKERSRFKNDECAILDSSDPMEPTFEISLGNAGLIFSTSYAPATADFCDVYGVEIPFQKLNRFLTPEGRQSIENLRRLGLGQVSEGRILAPHRVP